MLKDSSEVPVGIEIERKFLVTGEFKSQAFNHKRIIQGYISTLPEKSVRVRIAGDTAFLTIKGKSQQQGLKRSEWEYSIPVEDAEELLLLCEKGIIEKTRYYVKSGNLTFEVDEFYGDNKGLILAEVELTDENEEIKKPEWLGEEVTGIVKYYNAYLVNHPYKNW